MFGSICSECLYAFQIYEGKAGVGENLNWAMRVRVLLDAAQGIFIDGPFLIIVLQNYLDHPFYRNLSMLDICNDLKRNKLYIFALANLHAWQVTSGTVSLSIYMCVGVIM